MSGPWSAPDTNTAKEWACDVGEVGVEYIGVTLQFKARPTLQKVEKRVLA